MIHGLVSVVMTVVSLGLVVVIHEYGHFLVARRLGVRVERFTVGFGPEVFGWTRGATRYALCAIPLGGMVKLAGDLLEEHMQKPDEFFSQPWYKRSLIALAGPVMNYVLAFVLFAVVAGVWGILQPSNQPIVGEIVPGLPAASSALRMGDRIQSIDGVPMTSWEQMARLIHDKPGAQLQLEVQRVEPPSSSPRIFKTTITPSRDAQRGVGLIGIMPQVEKVRVGLRGSLVTSAKDLKAWTLQPLKYITEKIKRFEGPRELSGPLGIAQMVTKATQEGLAYVLYLMGIISTGLGLFNLFPIPILDGGHIFLYTIEGILRRPLNRRTMQIANAVGFSLILTIFLYASYQDVLRWRLGLWK